MARAPCHRVVSREGRFAVTRPRKSEPEVERLRRRVAELERTRSEPERIATALRESEAQFRALVAAVPGMIYRSEAKAPWRDLLVSDNVFQLCGYSAQELTRPDGTAFGDLVLEEDRAIIADSIADAPAHGGTFDIRYRLRHADGRIRWVHDQGKVITSPEDGTPLLLDGVISDITDEIEAEHALRESEERFRTLVANIPGAVYRCGVQWPYPDILLSDGVEAITGHSAREHLRSKELDFGARVLPEERDRIEMAVAAAVASGTTFELRYRIRHADGGIRWVQETGRATYAPDGTPLFLDGVLLDITAQKLAEEALRKSEARLVEAQRIAQVGSWELDLRTHALHWSEEIYRIFELDPKEFGATYESFLATIHPDDREMVHQAFTHSVTQQSSYDLVHRLRMPDGRVKYVHERAEILYAEDGRPMRTAGTVQDITERRVAEQARQALEGQLRQAQKMEALGTLAGGIAHDFNNILAAVIGHAELLAQDLAADQEGREGVEEILVASRRARDLVQQILTFSRLRERERRLIALEPVVLEALKLLRASLPTTIEIRTTVTPEDHLVLADTTQIHQVVLNLCTNAAHAMQEHGGVLDVSCHSVEVDAELAKEHPGLNPGLYMRLSVRDTGHGMDRLTLDRIFDPFFTTKQPGEGTGLGLAVVHGIMQSHDGAVTVASEPGAGTVFSLYFPAIEGRAIAASREEPPEPRGTGQRVLLVDDEPALVRIATRVLERLGYQVIPHTEATAALADFLARPDAFDLVLTDLTMPRMTGLELAREITARRPELPVILTSGYSGALDLTEIQEAGIREVLGKPFLARTIAEVVDRVLRSA